MTFYTLKLMLYFVYPYPPGTFKYFLRSVFDTFQKKNRTNCETDQIITSPTVPTCQKRRNEKKRGPEKQLKRSKNGPIKLQEILNPNNDKYK